MWAWYDTKCPTVDHRWWQHQRNFPTPRVGLPTQVALRNRKQGHVPGNGRMTQVDNREQSRRWPSGAQVRGERVR